MRLTLNGNTQLLYDLMVGIDARWPHVNVHFCRLYFPEQAVEAGNASANCKVGGSGVTSSNVDVWDILQEGDKKDMQSAGDGQNRISLKTTYVRGSANNTILIIEPHIG